MGEAVSGSYFATLGVAAARATRFSRPTMTAPRAW